MKVLFLFAGLISLSGLSQEVKHNLVDAKVTRVDPQDIILKQKTITRQVSQLVDLTKNHLTQLAMLRNQLADKKSRLLSLSKSGRTAQEETAYQTLKKEIADLESKISKLELEKEETSKKITAYQKDLAECDQQLKEIVWNRAAVLFGRTQLLLDSLPPSERKLDPEESITLDHYYNLYKTSPVFSQKVKEYWRMNTREEPDDKFAKARDRNSLSPEIQLALKEKIKEHLKELKSMQKEVPNPKDATYKRLGKIIGFGTLLGSP